MWREEHNFRIESIAALAVIFSIYYFDFTLIESGLCFVAILLVICAEIVNTAFEDLCNKIEPSQDPAIGKIKDTMAGFVLISALGALTLGVLVVHSHFNFM